MPIAQPSSPPSDRPGIAAPQATWHDSGADQPGKVAQKNRQRQVSDAWTVIRRASPCPRRSVKMKAGSPTRQELPAVGVRVRGKATARPEKAEDPAFNEERGKRCRGPESLAVGNLMQMACQTGRRGQSEMPGWPPSPRSAGRRSFLAVFF